MKYEIHYCLWLANGVVHESHMFYEAEMELRSSYKCNLLNGRHRVSMF